MLRREFGAHIIRVYRPGIIPADHQSEREQAEIDEDFQIQNTGSLAQLREVANYAVSSLVLE